MNDYTVAITTGSSSKTFPRPDPDFKALPALEVTEDTRGSVWLFSPARWKGVHVWVAKCTGRLDDPMFHAPLFDEAVPICPPFEHDLYPMTHYNPDGPDWGTGFLTCRKCLGTAHEPAEDEAS